jgi:hypothetical protein
VSIVDAADRFGRYAICTDPDCFARDPHPATGPHKFANTGEPAPRSIAATSNALVRIIREGLDVRGSDISEAWKLDRARNIAMAIMGTWDLSAPVIR